jgi:hypothetical protein
VRPPAEPGRSDLDRQLDGPRHQIGSRLADERRHVAQVSRGEHGEAGVAHPVGDLDRFGRTLDPLPEVAAEHPAQPAEQVEHAAAKLLVRVGVGERADEKRLGELEVVVSDVEAPNQGLRPLRTRRQRRDQRVGERQRPPRFAGGREMLDLGERTPSRRERVGLRSQPESMPGEVGGDIGRAPQTGTLAGGFEECGNAGVRLGRREREMTGPGVGVAGLLGQARVQTEAGKRAHPPVDHRADERVIEAHLQRLVDDEQPELLGDRQQLLERRLRHDVGQLAHRRRAESRYDLENGQELGRHGLEPAGNGSLDGAGKRETVGQTRGPAVRFEAAGQLDRVERIAGRHGVDPAEQRP